MLTASIRTIFFYIFIVISYRIMGKREVGELGIIDLMISILIGQLIAVSIENYKESMFLTIIPISILVLLEVILAKISLKSRNFTKLTDGLPTTIISNGKIIYNNMIKEKYTIDDLLLNLRNEGIDSIEDVSYAILEINGKLSVFKSKNYPLPLIIESKIQYNTLKEINKSINWLNITLNKNNISLEEIFYGIYKNNHLYLIKYR